MIMRKAISTIVHQSKVVRSFLNFLLLRMLLRNTEVESLYE